MKLDDPFNGHWTAGRAKPAVRGRALTFTFAPLTRAEVPGGRTEGQDYRLTYKLRVTCTRAISLTGVAAFSDAVTRRARLRFEWQQVATAPGGQAARFEARNGRVLAVHRLTPSAVEVDVEFADAPDRLSADRGHVVCRNGEIGSFAVFVDDVRREGALVVRDLGVRVSEVGRDTSRPVRGPPAPNSQTALAVRERVARLPEQSFAQVSQAIPAKAPRYLFLGVPDLRQEIALLPQGAIQLRADSLRSPGPDTALRPWSWEDLTFDFGAGEHPSLGPTADRDVSRRLEEGWLPVVRHEWQHEQIRYVQTSLALPLEEDLATLQSETGTETVVLATRFEFTNTAPEPRTAWLWMELSRSQPCRFMLDDTLVLLRPSDGKHRAGLVPVRARFNIYGRGGLDVAVLVPSAPGSYNPGLRNSAAAREAVRYQVQLAPAQSHAIELFVPYVELLDAAALAALRTLAFTNAHQTVARFWHERTARGMTYQVPDQFLNDLFKANLWHVLISTDLDPTTHQSQHGAATHQYGNFLNETAMVVRSLEMRGEHEAARRLLDPFLANQSVRGLPGNFRSQDGVLYAAHPTEPDPYTAQGYNMHHGFGLWAAAEHFLWTNDLDYLWHAAPRLVAGADWVSRERQATRTQSGSGPRPVEYGLAPAGDLEDVEEYLYYYATDAYFHLGMKRAVEALRAGTQAAANAPRSRRPSAAWLREVRAAASRLAAETASFRRDIRASVAESVATSPVVRLGDGAYAPFVPPRAHALTHLKEGWIREALYPALHLVTGEVYDARHPFVSWMIDDLEDNIFLSPESGYGVTNAPACFFDCGGFTLQPNLLGLPRVYLERDEVPNFLRAFYNTAWTSLYPDAVCFAEWVPKFGVGAGPLYKTPDECRFIQTMREMLVLERGESLELGLGVPRAWMREGQRIQIQHAATLFGQLNLEITSQPSSSRVLGRLNLVTTHPPKAIRLRLRHPDGKPIRRADVNDQAATVDAARQLVNLPVRARRWEVEARF
jgi:hypothetical protein